ncbi:MAG: hypothetical protein HOM21_00975 [Halobacteriovoraceae bacterium]|nr:hypothetical protein [Halobacteriovoraceae bacterium]
MAEDLKERGITVLLLHPGHVRTDMTRGNGLLDATESAVGMLKIIEQKEHSQTGTFWHTSGEQLLW